MGKHGKSKKHSPKKKSSHSDSDSSDSERTSSKKTIFGLGYNTPHKTVPTYNSSKEYQLADFLQLPRIMGSSCMWSQQLHAQCTSIYASELAVLKHAPNRNVVVPDLYLEQSLRPAAEAFPEYKDNFQILEKELPERRAYYADKLDEDSQAEDRTPGSGGGGFPPAPDELRLESTLQDILDSKEIGKYIKRPELFGLLFDCAMKVSKSGKFKDEESASIKSLSEYLAGKEAKASDSSPIIALKRDLLVKMQVLKPKSAAKSVKDNDDDDIHPLSEIGDNNGIPKPRVTIEEAHSIGYANLHKFSGFSHAVLRIMRKVAKHHEVYIDVLTRCAAALPCQQMKATLQEWGHFTSEDFKAQSTESEKLFLVMNTPRCFMSIAEKNFVGLKLPQAIREEETTILNSLCPLTAKNDSDHVRNFKAQAAKCAEVGCAFDDITLVIKLLNGYKRALADQSSTSPRVTSARYVYGKLNHVFDEFARQKKLDEIMLSYFVDLAARTSTELNDGANQTGNNQHHQRGGGNSSKRGKSAPPSQSQTPYNQFAASAAAEPPPQRSKQSSKNKKQQQQQQQGGGGGGNGKGQGKGKGNRPPYCYICKKPHVQYGDDCPAARNQPPANRGGPPQNAHQAAANTASSQELVAALKLITDRLTASQNGSRLD